MFGNAKSAFTALGGELRLRQAAAPSAFLGQAPAAPAPSSPVQGPVSATPAPVTAPAPAVAPAPAGIPHQTQVLIGGLLAGATILGAILFSD